jgi:hypothetical protein
MVVATFSDLIQYYNGRCLTHISQELLYSTIIEGVVYGKVHRYITTGTLRYEEWSEEWLWTDKEEW